ncbi:LuxR C-terminal-related transcriptional regulator [uncultured Agrobacterium sp.]|uniref:helix-turn-helix transcriptional regulator n=1 Tax=uncultured Agrobacterium sp. TaxID=157277 RepID=UPI0025F76C34|nr:LuxR C-terminal-related transcriptional regulator [uncultured Agrobacterium sp.]
MPFSRTLASTLSFDHAVDLSSLPVRRHLPSHPFVERLRAAVPFDFFAVSGLDLDGYRFGSGHSIDTNVPPAYLDAYYGDGLLASDPFVKASSTATGVVIEQEIYKQDPPSERLLYLAHTFGVLNRTLFPIRRLSRIFGAVTFSRSTPFDREEIDFLGDISGTMHTIITKPIMERFAAQEMRLTDGELDCLRIASLGKTSEEIASACRYTTDTVNSYIKAATKKLSAKNRSHAIAEAIRRGLIE